MFLIHLDSASSLIISTNNDSLLTASARHLSSQVVCANVDFLVVALSLRKALACLASKNVL
jgi:hypothetical protein